MNIMERQQALIDDFNFFDDWSDKYAYLIGLGKNLEPFPESKKDEAHMVKGCQSQVWFDAQLQQGKLMFHGISDAAIVSGLIGLLLQVYSDAFPHEILDSTTDFMTEIGLAKHLSPTRNNGLYAMINYIYSTAQKYVDATTP
ncbi:SufE family protein [Fastidiosibacter lacustris]|uniref:SufE family protein n=1 Tax=Fastidiosibacter lacustris TaxID=2056695 RepID=UPI000E352E11|nr:SufE family protein [Fastidiosibacter lacustris]